MLRINDYFLYFTWYLFDEIMEAYNLDGVSQNLKFYDLYIEINIFFYLQKNSILCN